MQISTYEMCGYVYYPAIGDPKGNITVGTPFEKSARLEITVPNWKLRYEDER